MQDSTDARVIRYTAAFFENEDDLLAGASKSIDHGKA